VGGIHVTLGDGGVRFISENIDHKMGSISNTNNDHLPFIDSTFERLLGRADGQVIGDF
jgi:hypothetical protein